LHYQEGSLAWCMDIYREREREREREGTRFHKETRATILNRLYKYTTKRDKSKIFQQLPSVGRFPRWKAPFRAVHNLSRFGTKPTLRFKLALCFPATFFFLRPGRTSNSSAAHRLALHRYRPVEPATGQQGPHHRHVAAEHALEHRTSHRRPSLGEVVSDDLLSVSAEPIPSPVRRGHRHWWQETEAAVRPWQSTGVLLCMVWSIYT
jgi:hypothetical protein